MWFVLEGPDLIRCESHQVNHHRLQVDLLVMVYTWVEVGPGGQASGRGDALPQKWVRCGVT